MGECIADERAWIIKTHHPLSKEVENFTTCKAICCVRNPLDVITSMFNFAGTHSQSSSVTNDTYTKLKDDWDKMMRNEASCWKDFHDYWIKKF